MLELLQFSTLLVLSLLGLVSHWAKRALRNQTKSSFIQYMKVQPEYTLRTLGLLLGGVATITASGVEIFTLQTLSMAFLIGYTLDSGFNKDHD